MDIGWLKKWVQGGVIVAIGYLNKKNTKSITKSIELRKNGHIPQAICAGWGYDGYLLHNWVIRMYCTHRMDVYTWGSRRPF